MFTFNIIVNETPYNSIAAENTARESLELMCRIGTELSKHIRGYIECHLLKNGKVLKRYEFERGLLCAEIK